MYHSAEHDHSCTVNLMVRHTL